MTKYCEFSSLTAHLADVMASHAYFPRGMFQPEGSFRFSADALLLASFASNFLYAVCPEGARTMDLGAGCGVVGLAMLILDDKKRMSKMSALELNSELSGAANENAVTLGFMDKYLCRTGDVGDYSTGIKKGVYDLVVSNPPYRLTGHGRLPKSKIRANALFSSKEVLGDFFDAAAWGLCENGVLCVIFPYARKQELCILSAQKGLTPMRVKTIVSVRGHEPCLFLLAAQKGYSKELMEDTPLVLYDKSDGVISEEAIDFCPFLACNRNRRNGAVK